MRLDRDIELDSDAYMQRRREAIEHFERGGVEVAPAHYYHRDLETSTISDSYYYGSRNSMEMQGYVSSSQAPDTNSYYESSDCRVGQGSEVKVSGGGSEVKGEGSRVRLHNGFCIMV